VLNVNSGPFPRYHRGSCVCERYELRITRRCLTSDLGFDATATFEDCRSHPIVRALEHQRSAEPAGTRTVGPTAGDRTVYRLGLGHDHRGATWYDPEENVIWLCAYGPHRSGEPDDAFPYFHELIEAGVLLPTEEDYAALFEDRDYRFAETVHDDAQRLLALARSTPGIEQLGKLGGEETTGVLVEVVDTLEETYVAFSIERMDSERLIVILAALYVDAEFSDWELAASLPTRPLRQYEVCYRILRG